MSGATWTREQHNAIAAGLVSRGGCELDRAAWLATTILDWAYHGTVPPEFPDGRYPWPAKKTQEKQSEPV